MEVIMKSYRYLWSVLLFAFCFSINAQVAQNDPAKGEMEKAQKIYDVDFYGAKGTDFLLEKKVLQDEKRLKGWIVVIDGEKKARVIFYGKNVYSTGYIGYHQATFDGKAVTYQDVSEKPLTQAEIALVKARELVVSQFKPTCEKKYNTAVFQYENRIAVYMLASTTVHGEIPLGGSEVFYTDPKGEKILDKKAFFNSCLTLENKENTVSMVMNQVVGNIPNEIIAFASIAYDIPFMVITPDKQVWDITKGKIVKKAMPNARRGR